MYRKFDENLSLITRGYSHFFWNLHLVIRIILLPDVSSKKMTLSLNFLLLIKSANFLKIDLRENIYSTCTFHKTATKVTKNNVNDRSLLLVFHIFQNLVLRHSTWAGLSKLSRLLFYPSGTKMLVNTCSKLISKTEFKHVNWSFLQKKLTTEGDSSTYISKSIIAAYLKCSLYHHFILIIELTKYF